MDEVDERIIEILKRDGRIPFVDVAKKLNLTEGAIRARVKKLVHDKVILKFTVDLENSTRAIVSVGTSQSIPTEKVSEAIRALGIEHVYEVSGNYDIVCFVQAKNTTKLNDIIEKIRSLKGVIDTSTSMVLK